MSQATVGGAMQPSMDTDWLKILSCASQFNWMADKTFWLRLWADLYKFVNNAPTRRMQEKCVSSSTRMRVRGWLIERVIMQS